MLRLSGHAHLCIEHFAECDFAKLYGGIPNGVCSKAEFVHRVTDLEKIPVRISKDEADEQQVYSMIPKIERYPDTLKQALTRQRQKV